MPVKMPMMAITTSSSIRVKPLRETDIGQVSKKEKLEK
jgi:hypothetical protein